MAVRPPADAIVALRSMGRRWRGLFASLTEDESPDALAHRVGGGGHSAIDHLVAATRSFTFLGRALEQALTDEDAVLHPAVAHESAREWGDPGGTVDDRLTELAWEADALADRAAKVTAEEWGVRARVAGTDATTSTLAILWDAVDSAVAHLKHAEEVLTEVRGQPQ